MQELKDKYIRFDWAIKRLLRQKANFGVLEGFLTVFIGEPIQIIEILESEGNNSSFNSCDSTNRVVVKTKNNNGEIILVDIHNFRILHYCETLFFHWNDSIFEHINLGSTYKEVKKVYSISILYFDLGKGSDYIYVGQNNFVGLHTKDNLVISTKEKDTIVRKSPSEIFPTYMLVRVNEFNNVAKSPLEEWVNYLKNGVIQPDTTTPGLQEAREKLKYYSMSNAERHAYDEHINAIMIQNDVLGNAKLEGRAEGRAEEKCDIARKMLACGMPTEQIMQITGLTEEQIEKL